MKDALVVLLVILVVVGIITGIVSATALSHVDGYYVASPNTAQVSSVTCAYAHWTRWHSDEIAFCSDDNLKVIDFVAKANASLGRR